MAHRKLMLSFLLLSSFLLPLPYPFLFLSLVLKLITKSDSFKKLLPTQSRNFKNLFIWNAKWQITICWFPPQMVTTARSGPDKSQELYPGLPCEWQVCNIWAVTCCLSKHIKQGAGEETKPLGFQPSLCCVVLTHKQWLSLLCHKAAS